MSEAIHSALAEECQLAVGWELAAHHEEHAQELTVPQQKACRVPAAAMQATLSVASVGGLRHRDASSSGRSVTTALPRGTPVRSLAYDEGECTV